MEKRIYLDNASTTYPKPEAVYQALNQAGRHLSFNAGRGFYGWAREAFDLIESARDGICGLADSAPGAEVVFCPSATIACNQVLRGLEWQEGDTVYVTPFEHNAVMRVLHYLQKRYRISVEELAVKPDTLELDQEKIEYQFLRNPPGLLAMAHVSNVSGYIVPWREIAKLAEPYHPTVMLDGSQALGTVPVSLQDTAVDFYVFAGHKSLYGPFGIGGYINNRGKKLKQLLFGGTGSDSLNLEMRIEGASSYEPGSMNITAVAGLKAALESLEGELALEDGAGALQLKAEPERTGGKLASWYFKKEQALRKSLAESLGQIPGVLLYPPFGEEAAGILSFNIEGYQAQEVGILLDEEYQIAVRAGYHCAPLIHRHLQDGRFGGTVRISLGRFTTGQELECLKRAVQELAQGHS